MDRMNSEVDEFLLKSKKWQREMALLRKIALDCNLTEETKWGKPCYSLEGKNIAIIQPFKEFLALMFFKGSLLSDSKNILQEQGENSQSALRAPFTNLQEIEEVESTLVAYLLEAIEVEKEGLKVAFKEKNELVFPDELLTIFDEKPELEMAFKSLTPGRQRHYNLHFSGAKQSKTRSSRIEKCIPRILDGKGLNDR